MTRPAGNEQVNNNTVEQSWEAQFEQFFDDSFSGINLATPSRLSYDMAEIAEGPSEEVWWPNTLV
jgi:hypothetical protein